MGSQDIGALDRPSLERFRTELIKIGFEPERGDIRVWSGPIADCLRDLTAATSMKIKFVDGWPFRNPKLFVDGLDEWHLSASGEVCLWASGAASNEWLTVDGFLNRIDEWAEHARKGFRPEDFALDAHLSFGVIRAGAIATIDLSSLRLDGREGELGKISGTWKDKAPVLQIVAGPSGAIEGRWYYIGKVRTPPRSLGAVAELLTRTQRNNFDRRFKAIDNHGKPRLFLLAWDREFGREALVLYAEKREGDVLAEAIEVAPTDAEILKLRAGPHVGYLSGKSVIVFGVGAVGSNLALRLAEVGVGNLVVVDGDRLRPGDIVRHAAGSFQVGDSKVAAVRFLAHIRAPWTTVRPIEGSTWNPDEIAILIEGNDLVVDATGFTSFANLLSVICGERAMPLISAALYRGGAVGRVRRQALPSDTPILDRAGKEGYPMIPQGDEPVSYEPGCSAPVNNASPTAVASVASLAGHVVIDILTSSNLYPDEIIDVYRPLEISPFDQLGRIA